MSTIQKKSSVFRGQNPPTAWLAWLMGLFRTKTRASEYDITQKEMTHLLQELENPSPISEHCVGSLKEILKDTKF
jgi:hypothetical protein